VEVPLAVSDLKSDAPNGGPTHPIDDTDRRIIDLLEQNARRTFGDIGSIVGLSAPAVKRRLDRLEDAGVVIGYTTRIDQAKLGRPLQAFIELRFAGSTGVDAIAGIAKGIPEMQEMFTIAGDPDALVWVRVRDVGDLKRVIDLLRKTGPVTGTKTLMVLGTSKDR
jgi:Lrp/AsnC family transcriptional regulator, leucine-responsive regulatory protein